MSIEDYLLGLDLEEMCDELGITGEDILYRFREKVYNYTQRVDFADQWDYDEGLDENEEDISKRLSHKTIDELLDEMD